MIKPNYPFYDKLYTMLSTPERTQADPRFIGRGVVMAFIDSGFYPHPDLGDRVLVHADATSNRIVEGRRFAHDPADYAWHGQMTSVIAAGDGRVSGGKYRGIASGAHLVLIKVSTRRRQIKEPDILRGMKWLLDHHRRFGVRVLNVSVGGDYVSDDPAHPLHRVVKALTDEGIVVMIAAGNGGTPELVPPASAPEAITVGGYNDQNSLNKHLWRPYNNNYGNGHDSAPKPEITAPAAWIPSPLLPGSREETEARWLSAMLRARSEDDIRALLRAGYRDLLIVPAFASSPDAGVLALLQERVNKYKLIDARHQHVDGTSVSTAVASSIVAQLLEINPALTPAQIKDNLMDTARPLPGLSAHHQGAGCLVAAEAVGRVLATQKASTYES